MSNKLPHSIEFLYDELLRRVKGYCIVRLRSPKVEWITSKQELKNYSEPSNLRYLSGIKSDCDESEVALFQNNKCIGIVKLMAYGDNEAQFRRLGFKMQADITIVRMAILTEEQLNQVDEFLCKRKQHLEFLEKTVV